MYSNCTRYQGEATIIPCIKHSYLLLRTKTLFKSPSGLRAFFPRFNSFTSKTRNVWCLPKISFMGKCKNCSQLGSTNLYYIRQEQFCCATVLIYALYVHTHLLCTDVHTHLHSQSWVTTRNLPVRYHPSTSSDLRCYCSKQRHWRHNVFKVCASCLSLRSH